MIRDDKGNPIPTSPKLTEESFDSIEGDLPKRLARRNVLVHRKRMLKNIRGTDGEETGLTNLVRADGRIAAGAFSCGTNTRRMRHTAVVNIPGADAVYGPEIRELFIVPDDCDWFGIDAQALEARCLAHFLLKYPGGDYIADILLNKDIHEENAKLWGCTRKEAKSPYYALSFGAQPPKLAQTMGVSLDVAQRYFDDYWSHYEALAMFRDDLVKTWESRGGKRGGFLKGIDGGKLFARHSHSLVNLMIQSTGSILVKLATIWTHKRVKQLGIPAHQIIHMHDEFNMEVKKGYGEQLKQVAEQSFLDAGNFFKLSVPLEGVGMLGANWRVCH
jgi:DNA polymerase I-like protein with 3'-5' exonuclease and polymerase domains